MTLKAILDITVSPRSSKNRITIDTGGKVKAYLTAPPVDGKANAELVRLLSKGLGVPTSDLEIISGHKSRKKRIVVTGRSTEQITAALKNA
ncbi:MAG: hypothetical protein A2176_02305 [Spirochaetes bacterium RBG_13_51_14]|nr:MAG: hypothetical protein A2176_02305 [Spirochaetes bacterium RBG_13_51_14]